MVAAVDSAERALRDAGAQSPVAGRALRAAGAEAGFSDGDGRDLGGASAGSAPSAGRSLARHSRICFNESAARSHRRCGEEEL